MGSASTSTRRTSTSPWPSPCSWSSSTCGSGRRPSSRPTPRSRPPRRQTSACKILKLLLTGDHTIHCLTGHALRSYGSLMRIYFVGSHATGKTTLCRYVSRRYNLPMITEVARMVLAEMETNLDALRTDVDLVADYQRRVFERQVTVERL